MVGNIPPHRPTAARSGTALISGSLAVLAIGAIDIHRHAPLQEPSQVETFERHLSWELSQPIEHRIRKPPKPARPNPWVHGARPKVGRFRRLTVRVRRFTFVKPVPPARNRRRRKRTPSGNGGIPNVSTPTVSIKRNVFRGGRTNFISNRKYSAHGSFVWGIFETYLGVNPNAKQSRRSYVLKPLTCV